MSHGEHRQLEIAMALATRPRMLLLDEPMAGMGPEESVRMIALLRELKRELTILLIEHDMDAVFALADRISVLVYGRVIASGAPAAIRANAEVRKAYLGEQESTGGVMADALLEVDGIETCYGRSQVLFGISLAIAAGEMVTLMGRNGMGKTTTVRSIMGLTPAMAGSIRFAGVRDPRAGRPIVSASSASAWCRRAGRCFPISPRARISSPPPPTAAARPIRGRSTRSARCSRGWPSASTTWATSSRAASSRCWRSAAR